MTLHLDQTLMMEKKIPGIRQNCKVEVKLFKLTY